MSDQVWLVVIYAACAILTMLLCLWVVWSYYRNSHRRQAPGGLMLSKSISDLVIGFAFLLMVVPQHQPGYNDNRGSTRCSIYAGIWSFVFITSQGYFMAICWDLYRTLKNPFRKPAADSIKIHLLVWSIAATLVITVDKMKVFKYRDDYGVCFTCNTGKTFSPYNALLYYIPLSLANIGGIVMLIYAIKRLSKGLEKTFELRRKTIRRQFVIVCCFSIAIFVSGLPWLIFVYYPSLTNEDSCYDSTGYDSNLCIQATTDCIHNHGPRILLTLLVLMQGIADFLAWFLVGYFETKKSKNRDRIKKKIIIKHGRATSEEEILIKSGGDVDDNDDYDDGIEGKKKKKNQQNVSNALRGEVIAYMTAGLDKSVKYTAQETYDSKYSHMYDQTEFTQNNTNIMMDTDNDNYNDVNDAVLFDDDDDDIDHDVFDDEKLQQHKSTSHVNAHAHHKPNISQSINAIAPIFNNQSNTQSNNSKSALDFLEPEPQNTHYPMHINHDPATHKGVINEIYVELPTQDTGFLSTATAKLDIFKSKNPFSPNSSKLNSRASSKDIAIHKLKTKKVNKKSHQNNQRSVSFEIHKKNNANLSASSTNTVGSRSVTSSVKQSHRAMSSDDINKILTSLSPKIKKTDNKQQLINPKDNLVQEEEEKIVINNPTDDDVLPLYESQKSNVEMQATSPNDIDIRYNNDIKDDVDDDDDMPRFPPKQSTTSLGINAQKILGTLQSTLSRVAATLNNDNDDEVVDESKNIEDTSYNNNNNNMNTDDLNQQFSFVNKQFTSSSTNTNTNVNNTSTDGIPFKSYAPHVFRYLRQQIYNISDSEYLLSVRPPDLKEQSKLVQEKFSEGRSGAFFFFTHDSKYIIKTVTKEEASLLLKILPSFVKHYADNPATLINKFFGLHSINMYNLTLYFVVLENVFVAGAEPHEKYDLKGSWIDRHTNHHVESGKLMKDEDLHKTLKLIPSESDKMYSQLKRDSLFLQNCGIMDYSVLLGIYYVGIDPSDVQNNRIMNNHHDNNNIINNNYQPPSIDDAIDDIDDYPTDLQTTRSMPDDYSIGPSHLNKKRRRAPSYSTGIKQYASKEKAVCARVIEGPGIYYLGIIDVLQEWNTMKKLERFAKVYLRCKNSKGISCIEPEFYRKRFLRKMYRIGIRSISSFTPTSKQKI